MLLQEKAKGVSKRNSLLRMELGILLQVNHHSNGKIERFYGWKLRQNMKLLMSL